MQVSRTTFFKSLWALPAGFLLGLVSAHIGVWLIMVPVPLAITLATAHIAVPGPSDLQVHFEATALAFWALALSVLAGDAAGVVMGTFVVLWVIAAVSISRRGMKAPLPTGPPMSMTLAIVLHLAIAAGSVFLLALTMV